MLYYYNRESFLVLKIHFKTIAEIPKFEPVISCIGSRKSGPLKRLDHEPKSVKSFMDRAVQFGMNKPPGPRMAYACVPYIGKA